MTGRRCASGQRRRPPLTIELSWRLRRDWRALPLLRRVARYVAGSAGFRSGTLSIVIVGRRAMTTLHRRFMGLDEPTDVLTFDLGTDAATSTLDAEIVLCADVAVQRARRQKRLARTAARRELALYLTHGILHLSGYDDHDVAAFRRMHAREDELLVALGLGRVFNPED